MMSDTNIKDAILGRFKNIKKYCRQIPKDFEAKEIHGFRTEVKKLRAFIRLVKFVPKDPVKYKLPKKLKKLYSTAGAVRDIQLQLERMRVVTQHEARQPEQYEVLLNKNMNRKKKQLKKLLAQTSLHSIEKKVIAHLPKHLHAETIRSFVRGKTADIKYLSEKKDEKDDDIHSIRKNLKDLMYNVKSVRDVNLKTAFPPELSNESNLKLVEQLTDQLGLFTDMSAAISFTEPSYLDGIDATEREQLQHIRSGWIQEKNELREASIKDIHAQDVLNEW